MTLTSRCQREAEALPPGHIVLGMRWRACKFYLRRLLFVALALSAGLEAGGETDETEASMRHLLQLRG